MRKRPHGPCRAYGCGRTVDCAGYCSTHYKDVRSCCPPRPIRKQLPRGSADMSLEDRFWSKVDKSGGPDACWLWQGARGFRDYGAFKMPKGRTRIASRLAYELHHGLILTNPDMFVLHRCDNPLCCNPSHLFLGDSQANVTDMHNKGRAPVGERHPHAKLTDVEVVELRNLKRSGMRSETIAELFGVSTSYVNSVCRFALRKGAGKVSSAA